MSPLPGLVAALLAGAGALLAVAPRPASPSVERPAAVRSRDGWMLRWRWCWSLLAGAVAAVFVGGVAGVGLGVVACLGCWAAIGRAEPAAVRREREQVTRELPHLVRLLGAALAAGCAPVMALEAIVDAAPGPASAHLDAAVQRLRLGADAIEVWSELAQAPAFGPLGRALLRAHAAGAPVADAVRRLADDLARSSRADAEARARAVGVRAAVPLGLCLLPCFLLVGVVPLAAGLLGTLPW